MTMTADEVMLMSILVHKLGGAVDITERELREFDRATTLVTMVGPMDRPGVGVRLELDEPAIVVDAEREPARAIEAAP
jgi:hypothetical protein